MGRSFSTHAALCEVQVDREGVQFLQPWNLELGYYLLFPVTDGIPDSRPESG